MEKTQQQKKLEEFYEKRLGGYQKMMDRREEFLEKNAARLNKIQERNDNTLHVIRTKNDNRTEERRRKIEEKYIGGDRKKQARFDRITARRDRSTKEWRARDRKSVV